MIILKANTAYDIHFSTRDTDGNAADATGTPTAILFAGNTSLSGTVTVTVSSVSTGMYNASFTTPADISSYLGKTASLDISAMISTVAAKANKVIGMFDTKITSDNYAILTDGDYGLAQLVRATTPANTLDIDANGEVTVGAFNSNLSFTTNQNNAIASYSGLALHSYGTAKTSDLAGLATAAALATVDNIVDAILVDTSTTLPAQLTSIQSHGDSNWATATGFSTHSASDVWAVTTRALTDKANFALSTAGISAVQSGMATASALSAVDTVVDAIKVSTDKFETMIILDGAVYQYTTNSLENAPSGSGATPSEIDAYLTDRHGSGSWQTGGTGSGANAETITITDGTSPLDGVNVWATTDSSGVNIVASGYTNALGEVTFMLDSGTYYVWQQLAGYNFTNPQTLVVS